MLLAFPAQNGKKGIKVVSRKEMHLLISKETNSPIYRNMHLFASKNRRPSLTVTKGRRLRVTAMAIDSIITRGNDYN